MLTAVACVAPATFAASASAVTGHKLGGSIAVPATGGLAVNQSTRDLFVADSSGITRVDQATQTPTSFVAGGPFTALAADGKTGNVYALKPGTDPTLDPSVVDVYDSTGAQIGPLDGSTVTAGFFNPTAVAVDPVTSNVYVANVDPTGAVSPVIDVFDEAGAFKSEVTPDQALSSPSGLAIDSAGNLYVLDGGNVNRYGLDGVFSAQVYGDAFGLAVGVDPVANEPYVVAFDPSSFQPQVTNYDASGTVLFRFGLGEIGFASGIAVDGTDARAYVGDSSAAAVPFFDAFEVLDPTVTTGDVAFKISTATLNGTINPNLNLSTKWHFEYGINDFGTSAPVVEGDLPSGSTDVPVSTSISGLQPATTYQYRLVADRGTGPVVGDPHTFTTLDALTTLVVDPPSDVTKTSATFHGTVDNHGFNATYFFTVKATDSPYVGTTPQVALSPAAGPQAVTAALADLPIGGGFEVRLVATTTGGTVVSDPLGFRTQDSVFVPLPPPVVDLNPYGCVAPHLNAYTAKAKAGKAITLTGSDLGVGGVVSFGSSLADADSWSANAIRVVVPSGAKGSAAVKVDCSRESNTIKVGIAKATAKHKAKAKKCKKGYAKKKVKGKTRCVKQHAKKKARKGR